MVALAKTPLNLNVELRSSIIRFLCESCDYDFQFRFQVTGKSTSCVIQAVLPSKLSTPKIIPTAARCVGFDTCIGVAVADIEEESFCTILPRIV